MKKLWNQETEKQFFEEAMNNFASPEQLFYLTENNKYFAYWEKGYKGKKSTLQSRNSLIGKFTEKWSKDLIQSSLENKKIYAVQDAVCTEIGLTKQSPADVVISKKNQKILKAEDILLIFEVKMSIVWNWQLENDKLICVGDYNTHQGNPGLLRSDSMLKAIGKGINIRVASYQSSTIPILVLGNTPITDYYRNKVDHLKDAGIVQGFWSVNPQPLDVQTTLLASNYTPNKGFIQFQNFQNFQKSLHEILDNELNFFSSMKSKKELGKIIELANKKETYEGKAEKFLQLLRGKNE